MSLKEFVIKMHFENKFTIILVPKFVKSHKILLAKNSFVYLLYNNIK